MLFINLLILVPIHAENIWIDEEVIKNHIFNKAMFYLDSCNYALALKELQKIIDQYPGTDYAANAQLSKIELYDSLDCKDPQKALLEYQSMLQHYPNTKYWLIAKKAILYDQYKGQSFEA